jgi:phosphate transport system permease protein
MDEKELLDRLFKGAILTFAIIALLPLFHLALEAFYKGGRVLLNSGLKFFTETPPPPEGPVYGIFTSFMGTIELSVISAIISIPLAYFTALLSTEFPDSLVGRLVRILSKSLLEVPTIIIGIFVFAIIVVPMGTPSLLAGSIALSLVMLPYIETYVESALRSVPRTYKEAGYSMGMTRAMVALRVTTQIARRGVLAGFLLGFAKAMGETAPILFTIGRARTQLNLNPLGPGDSIPLLIYDYASAPYENMREVAWGATLVLILILLGLQVLVRLIAKEVKF